MSMTILLPPERVLVGVRAADKAAALAALARLAAEATGQPAITVLAKLSAREALGSTGIGGGIGVPHARIEGLGAPRAWFVRLARAIDFAAIDAAKVDLLFLLLSSPADDQAHLAALAAMTRRLRAPGVVAALRAAAADEAHGLLTAP